MAAGLSQRESDDKSGLFCQDTLRTSEYEAGGEIATRRYKHGINVCVL
jgi:hypothetical protein